MDKELIRVVIIFAGLVVIAGMIIWGMVKNRRAERKAFYGEKYEDDEVDVVPLGSALDDEPFDRNYAYEGDDEIEALDDDGYEDAYGEVRPAAAERPERYGAEPAPAAEDDKPPMPDIVQFGIVSKDLQGFNGMQLAVAFKSAGLTFGAMKIFEYRDAGGDAVFSVASINEPGTFPESGLDKFYCPGIVCFMQPDYLADSVAVFDQMTEETIAMLREQLF